ncbi:MAG: hypothetical protein AMXMBFR81_00700 [Chthonomonas sp.]
MRLEIVVPDTAPERIRQRLADLVRCLNETPDLVEDLDFDPEGAAGDEDEADLHRRIQAKCTPEVIANLMQQAEDIRAGNGLSLEQVFDFLEESKERWVADQRN